MAQDSISAERLGRYQLLEPIGGGPSGTVSRAKVFGVAGFERQFAVKRFLPELTGTAALAAQLSTAARAYGSLEHPRIARMAEFGVAHGQTFTAVEYVAGLDAARLGSEARLSGGQLGSGGALALVSQAARAIGYAHGRGLTHLGLAPSNLIVTPDGDVKITDFGICASTLPPRPTDVPRLANRIQYLAPEQLANEAGSAATDVFSLGVIAYELVTGQRTFRGDTPQQVAHAIMAGPPPDPPLPRPIVRVLQRCLARSPFERFPDARALADALDAALRVAPVPGTRRDVGAQVKATLDHLAALNDGQMSGMVSMNLATGPMPRIETSALIATLGHDNNEIATTEFVRPDLPVAGPAPMIGMPRPDPAAATLPDLPKPMTTVTGLAPPPIPVPPGFAPPPIPPPPPSMSGTGPTATLIGMRRPPTAPPPMIPVIKPRANDTGTNTAIPAVPPRPKRNTNAIGVERQRTATESEQERLRTATESDTPTMAGLDLSTMPGVAVAPIDTRGRVHERPTSALPPMVAAQLGADSARPTAELVPLGRELRPDTHIDEPQISVSYERERIASAPALPPLPSSPGMPAVQLGGYVPPERAARSSPLPPPLANLGAPGGEAVYTTAQVRSIDGQPSTRITPRRWPWMIVGFAVTAGVGVAAWYGIQSMDDGRHGATAKPIDAVAVAPPTTPADAGTKVAITPPTTPADAAAKVVITPAPPIDAAVRVAITPITPDAAVAIVAVAPIDATVAHPVPPPIDAAVKVAVTPIAPDAGAAHPTPPNPPPSSGGTNDVLAIVSTPPGARVFIDGADQGVTPLKLPASPDRHTAALLLAGHELYVAQLDGHGTFTIPLKDVAAPNGPAGIKVLKCAKERYYVFVDGKPTGQTCPTERIGVAVGAHTVEVYDVVTETRKSWPIVVKDTRLSFRVRIDG